MLNTESGAGDALAEALCSVADADAYHGARGREAEWGDRDDEEKEAALRRATDYMEAAYGERWLGIRATALQALSWPRAGVWWNGSNLLSNVVPVAIRRACAELALRALDADLLPDGGPPVVSETVGPISTTYARGASQAPRYDAVDALLRPYLTSWGMQSVRLERA